MGSTVETSIEIRPFHVDIPEEDLVDLRRRIAATRWPAKETVGDQSQGVQLEKLQVNRHYNFLMLPICRFYQSQHNRDDLLHLVVNSGR